MCSLQDYYEPVKQIDTEATNYMALTLHLHSLRGFHDRRNLGDVSFLLLLQQASRGFGIQIEPANFLEISLIEIIYKLRDHKLARTRIS